MDHVILDEAIELVDKTLNPSDRAIVLGNAAWQSGGDRDRGVAAGRALRPPTFLVGWDEAGEVGRGSGRSIPGFDLHEALHKVGAHLEKYGGHTMAAGFTIRRDKFDGFRVAFLASRASF